jgi:hypothetical protein
MEAEILELKEGMQKMAT